MTTPDRVRFLDHKGKRMLLVDQSSLSREEVMQVLNATRLLVAKQPPGRTLLVMVDVRGSRFNPDSIAESKRVATANEPWVLATATVGMDRLGAIMLKQVYSAAKRTFENFKTPEEAKDWLVQQQPPPAS